jgi:hypothetical protein
VDNLAICTTYTQVVTVIHSQCTGRRQNFKTLRTIKMPQLKQARRTIKGIAQGDITNSQVPTYVMPIASIALLATQKTGGDKIAFRVRVVMAHCAAGRNLLDFGFQTTYVDVCDDAGKLRTFGTADAAIKALVKEGLMGYAGDPVCTIEGENFAAPNPYTGDPVTRAQAQYVIEAGLLAKSNAALTKANGDMSIMLATGGYASSVVEEKAVQIENITSLVAYHTIQMATLAALIIAAGGVLPTV